jgi:hypothetical protein
VSDPAREREGAQAIKSSTLNFPVSKGDYP